MCFIVAMLKTLFIILLAAMSVMAQATRFEGQVVCCAECWAQADRTKVEFGTAEDLLKSKSCVEGGDPTLLAVREGDKFTLYQLEPAGFRLPGKNWLEFVGKRIAVSGTVQKKKNASVIRVDSLEVLAASLAERQAATTIGKEIELTLKDPFGTEQRLSSLKGRIVILNFWATYCIPCRKEMPDLATLHSEFGPRGLVILAISDEELAKVEPFVKQHSYPFPMLLDPGRKVHTLFGVDGIPKSFIYDRDGKLVGTAIDMRTKGQFLAMLAKAGLR